MHAIILIEISVVEWAYSGTEKAIKIEAAIYRACNANS